MRTPDLIEKKKRGEALSTEEIEFLIRAYTAGEIPDYQMSALAMAIWFRSMNEAETAALTDAMARSGDTVDLSRFGSLSVDKHSTGGVGDKTTLIVIPLAASLGCKVAKMSGRGLGHTGGTVDKLASIPGYRTTLSPEEFLRQVEEVGAAVIGQSGNLAPADKKLYALRDVTATVDSIPLIASSIMSKKLAAGSHSIVLDVKLGSGAFMKTEAEATSLAETMCQIGRNCHRQVSAVLTNMDIPLGHAIGNALEVGEAVEVLRGGGPDDLREVSLTLAAEMVALTFGIPEDAAREKVEQSLRSGAAWESAKAWIAAQGGDVAALTAPGGLPEASCRREILAREDGYIAHMDAEQIGLSAMVLGAGRATQDDVIDPAAGLRLLKKTGDFVRAGETVAVLYTSHEDKLDDGESRLRAAIRTAPTPPEKQPLVYRIIRA